jgi:membrane-associated phospholipid phosphatase
MNDALRRACVSGVICVTVLTAGVSPASAQSVSSLVTGTVTDFRNVASRESAIWLTIGLAAVGMNQSLDHPTSDAMSASKGAEGIFAPGELIGGAKFQLAGALVTYGVGRLSGHSRVSQFGADLVRANIVAQALTGAIKMSVRRNRPDGTEFSFPSGHTSVSFAAATVVQRHFGWRAGVPAYAAASYVAASRIQEKRHYLSDVAYGAVVGIVAGRAVTVGRGNYRFAVEPMVPAGGGAGISLTRR